MDFSSDTESVRSDITGTFRSGAGHSGASDSERARRRRKGVPQRAWMNDGDSIPGSSNNEGSVPSPRMTGSTGISNLSSLPDFPLFLPPTQQQLELATVPMPQCLQQRSSTPIAVPCAVPAAVVPVTGAPCTAASGRGKKSKQDVAGPCCHCGATSSPQWRKGPKGKPVLCNACGIRFLRNRTLTKVAPKKRKGGSAGSSAKRAKAAADDACSEEEEEEVELATDEVLAAEDAADDGPLGAGCSTRSKAAAAAAAAMDCEGCGVSEPAADASSAGWLRQSGQQPLPAGSRHVLIGSGKGLGSLMGNNPSLALALAMHQQEQRQQHSAPGSPHSSAQHCRALSSSPISNASAGCNLQYEGSGNDSGGCSASPPASPLLLAGSSGNLGCSSFSLQQPSASASCLMGSCSSLQLPAKDLDIVLPMAAPLSITSPTDVTPSCTTAAEIAAAAAGGDILRLVTEMAGMLGGVGPAIDFLKAYTSHTSMLASVAAGPASHQLPTTGPATGRVLNI